MESVLLFRLCVGSGAQVKIVRHLQQHLYPLRHHASSTPTFFLKGHFFLVVFFLDSSPYSH